MFGHLANVYYKIQAAPLIDKNIYFIYHGVVDCFAIFVLFYKCMSHKKKKELISLQWNNLSTAFASSRVSYRMCSLCWVLQIRAKKMCNFYNQSSPHCIDENLPFLDAISVPI